MLSRPEWPGSSAVLILGLSSDRFTISEKGAKISTRLDNINTNTEDAELHRKSQCKIRALLCHFPGNSIQFSWLCINLRCCLSDRPDRLIEFCEAFRSAVPTLSKVKKQPRIRARREVIEIFTDYKKGRGASDFSPFIICPVLGQHMTSRGFDISQERLDDGALISQVSR